MTRSLVFRMMLKDWYLSRAILVIIACVGTASVASLYLRDNFASLLGMIASLFAIIFLGVLMPTQTIVNERKRQNLAFVMSLPISPMQYTAAKVAANLLAYLALWLPIAVGMIGTVAAADRFDGLIPLMVVAALAPFAGFMVFLAVAIVSESETWSMTTMAASNVSYSLIWLFLGTDAGFWKGLSGPVAVWSTPIVSIVTIEIGAIVLALGGVFYLQSRKTDFV